MGDTKTESPNLTTLVGKLFPSKALFAAVCQSKGASDEYTVTRLCQFLRECGVKDFVYKSDQESSIIALMNEVLRRSQTMGDQFYGLIHTAVPENSAVGESASNARAERAVQTFEDMLRTYKSALEARMNEYLPCDHAVMYWMTEHTAHTYNKHFVQEDGRTPYEHSHGKPPNLKLLEFGEKVMWYVPKKLRPKMDLRWRLGIFLGQSQTSNESYIGLPNGNVVKTRSVCRIVQSGRWDSKLILSIKGLPGKPSVSQQDLEWDRIETSERPHVDADA